MPYSIAIVILTHTHVQVLKDVERKFNLRILSSRLNTLVNGEHIKDFLMSHQQKTTRATKLFTIDVSSLPPNLSIKQPTLRVGPKKHVVRDPSDPNNYQHYSQSNVIMYKMIMICANVKYIRSLCLALHGCLKYLYRIIP